MNKVLTLSSEMLSVRSAESFKLNSKCMVYPNGYNKITVANKPIFGKQTFESEKADSIVMDIHKPQNSDNSPREDSARRAKSKCFDIAMMNDFTHFITFTLDEKYINRYDGELVSEKVKTWLKNKAMRNNLKYLLIPEYHADGAIHMHGLVSGDIQLVDSNTRKVKGNSKPISLETMKRKGIPLENGEIVYNMPQWKLGHSTAIELYGELENVAKYITKYITKDLQKIFGNFYYAGGHLNRNPKIQYFDMDYESIDSKEYLCEATNTRFKYIDIKEEMNA